MDCTADAMIANVPTDLAPFVTFATYAGIALARQDESILSAKAFTSLALISLLTSPLLTLCQMMPALLQALSCFSRIEGYCELSSKPLSEQSISTASFIHLSGSQVELQDWPQQRTRSLRPLISFKDANISSSPDTEPILHRITLTINNGITMIIGPVGSGKSTLIASLLGGNTLKRGLVTSNISKFAFCSQDSWIPNDTIRQNILGSSEMDQKWYVFVCWACGLEKDLQVLPGGDLRMTGSNGISLSGEQRQRVVSKAFLEPTSLFRFLCQGSKSVQPVTLTLFHVFPGARTSGILFT